MPSPILHKGLWKTAEKWVPSITKAVLRACALYAASCSGISLGGLKMVYVCTVPSRGGRSCEYFGGYKTINRIPFDTADHLVHTIVTRGGCTRSIFPTTLLASRYGLVGRLDLQLSWSS